MPPGLPPSPAHHPRRVGGRRPELLDDPLLTDQVAKTLTARSGPAAPGSAAARAPGRTGRPQPGLHGGQHLLGRLVGGHHEVALGVLLGQLQEAVAHPAVEGQRLGLDPVGAVAGPGQPDDGVDVEHHDQVRAAARRSPTATAGPPRRRPARGPAPW
jgi:hypothetical protein